MQDYNQAKGRNQAVQNFVEKFTSEKTYKRVCECGNWLKFIADWEVDKTKLHAANFCKWPFCPLCNFRRARKDALRISVLMAYISDVHKKEFIFVTLTAPNVKADKLPDEVRRYNKAFAKLTERKEVSGMNHGYIRKLEITYNEKRDDYHPHFHIIFAVNRGYFSGGRYLKQERWLDLWRACMGDDSITQVDVRKVQRRKDADTLAESFDTAEFAKYAAKDSDYTKNEEVFGAFYNALYGRQRLVYSGLFASANAMFKNDELEEYMKQDKAVYYWEIMYTWSGKEYAEKSRRALDATDKLFLAKRGIETELCD